MKTLLDTARDAYTEALRHYNTAKQTLTDAKRELERLEGRAVITPEARAARRQANRRAQLLRSYPKLLGLSRAARRQALDKLLEQRDRTRVYVWCFDHMTTSRDPVTQCVTRRVLRSNQKGFKLYRAAIRLAAEQAQARRDADTARKLRAHLASLIDMAPREVRCFYPGEWRLISRALRPNGSDPEPGLQQQLYSLYQHIIRTHWEEDI